MLLFLSQRSYKNDVKKINSISPRWKRLVTEVYQRNLLHQQNWNRRLCIVHFIHSHRDEHGHKTHVFILTQITFHSLQYVFVPVNIKVSQHNDKRKNSKYNKKMGSAMCTQNFYQIILWNGTILKLKTDNLFLVG